jgi:hypothetical protein
MNLPDLISGESLQLILKKHPEIPEKLIRNLIEIVKKYISNPSKELLIESLKGSKDEVVLYILERAKKILLLKAKRATAAIAVAGAIAAVTLAIRIIRKRSKSKPLNPYSEKDKDMLLIVQEMSEIYKKTENP